MFHINRPLSPNSRWKWRFFQNLQGEWKFRKGTCPLKSSWEQKTITFTQGHPCWNRRLGFPRFFLPNCGSSFFGTKLWFKGGSPFWDPRNRSILLKLIRFEWMSFSWKIGCRSWSQKLSPLHHCTKCSMLSVLGFNCPGLKVFSEKAHVETFQEQLSLVQI